MGGQYKKKLRAEKAKVKLKGAKLSKGLNVTKTDFKVRKIAIREQLKESQYVDGQRVVDLKETLSRLKHHSSSYRMEALRNLKVSLAAADTKILSNLNELTQGISAICLDIDKDTRRESFKVLSSFLNALTIESVAPFFHVISSYLRCAMTHIQPAIQEDSLLMLDVLLQHVPHLIAENSGKIFQNFLEMISKIRSEGDKAGRVLTINMGNKQTTIAWRSKILQRLQQMLHILAAHKRANSSVATGGNNLKKLTHTFNNKAPQHFSLLRSFGEDEVCDLSAIFCRSISDNSNQMAFLGGGGGSLIGTARNDFVILQSCISHLMPLLLESWLEVRPQITTTAKSTDYLLLSHDSAFTLKVVLDIIKNLWTLVELHEQEVNNTDLSDWFCKEYAELFATHFMQAVFPYQQSEKDAKAKEYIAARGRQKSKKTPPDSGGQFCIQQNVNLVFLMCRFFTQNIANQENHFDRLLQYLNSIVDNMKAYPLESFTCLEPALRATLYQNGLQLMQVDETKSRALLSSIINAFLTNQFPTNEGVAARVLVLICDIARNSELHKAFGPENFNPFISYLPQMLLRPFITEQALLSMSNLGKQKNTVFIQALQHLFVPVIENLQSIQVQGACNALEGKKHIMNLYYWLDRAWSPEDQCSLKQKVQDCITDKRIADYCNFIITKS